MGVTASGIVVSNGVTASAGACGNLSITSTGNMDISGAMNFSSCTNSGSTLKAAAAGYIYQNTSITMKGGSVTYLSNADAGSGSSAGNIYLTSASSITTNGGDVIFAGGSYTVTTGYARGFATAFNGTGMLDSNLS